MASMDTVSIYQRDIESTMPETSEFPITSMSHTLSLALIAALQETGGEKPLCALDVGTGSGIHTAILASQGIPSLVAIDINKCAVALAQARFERLRDQIPGAAASQAAFKHMNVDDTPSLESAFEVIVTNPPSFFFNTQSGETNSPIEDGVYVGATDSAHQTEDSFLYRFFQKTVQQKLAYPGLVVCTWPALEHRLVHECPSTTTISHPADLLEKWFGWTIHGRSRQWSGFYKFSAPIGDYGLGEEFKKMLNVNLDRGRIYSSLVRAGTARSKWRPTFKFGVLALRRLSETEFELLDIADDATLPGDQI